nr:winged helix-turn-helix domain-containing protein [Vibrio cyclitrophicus]
MKNSPKAVGRNFLLEHGWPGRVVTGSSLNVAVKNIRTALNSLECDCKILTVQKEGYSFNGPSIASMARDRLVAIYRCQRLRLTYMLNRQLLNRHFQRMPPPQMT